MVRLADRWASWCVITYLLFYVVPAFIRHTRKSGGELFGWVILIIVKRYCASMHHFLVANFHIRRRCQRFVRWGLVRDGQYESYCHKNDILVIINDYFLEMGVCYVPMHHLFIRVICRGWKVGLADHMMRTTVASNK